MARWRTRGAARDVSDGPPDDPSAPPPAGPPAPSAPGRGPTRDRRGRGARGPAVVPLEPGSPFLRTAAERFDDLVLDLVEEVEDRWAERLGPVEYAVEDVPRLPDGWEPDPTRPGQAGSSVPLSSLVRGRTGEPDRLVLFRRPIEHRCATRDDLEALVLTVLVEQVAELLGLDPADVDDRYGRDDD